MNITLPPELAHYIEERVRLGGFSSSAEFVEDAIRQKMETDAWMEQKVLEAEQTELSPLTQQDLDSVRQMIRQPRESSGS